MVLERENRSAESHLKEEEDRKKEEEKEESFEGRKVFPSLNSIFDF